jgi:hypothetical protein
MNEFPSAFTNIHFIHTYNATDVDWGFCDAQSVICTVCYVLPYKEKCPYPSLTLIKVHIHELESGHGQGELKSIIIKLRRGQGYNDRTRGNSNCTEVEPALRLVISLSR